MTTPETIDVRDKVAATHLPRRYCGVHSTGTSIRTVLYSFIHNECQLRRPRDNTDFMLEYIMYEKLRLVKLFPKKKRRCIIITYVYITKYTFFPICLLMKIVLQFLKNRFCKLSVIYVLRKLKLQFSLFYRNFRNNQNISLSQTIFISYVCVRDIKHCIYDNEANTKVFQKAFYSSK